jgi:hypothetical protein
MCKALRATRDVKDIWTGDGVREALITVYRCYAGGANESQPLSSPARQHMPRRSVRNLQWSSRASQSDCTLYRRSAQVDRQDFPSRRPQLRRQRYGRRQRKAQLRRAFYTSSSGIRTWSSTTYSHLTLSVLIRHPQCPDDKTMVAPVGTRTNLLASHRDCNSAPAFRTLPVLLSAIHKL